MPIARFALVEQAAHKRERAVEITRGERIAELENNAGARERHKRANFLRRDSPIVADIEIDLLELVLDLPRVAAA